MRAFPLGRGAKSEGSHQKLQQRLAETNTRNKRRKEKHSRRTTFDGCAQQTTKMARGRGSPSPARHNCGLTPGGQPPNSDMLPNAVETRKVDWCLKDWGEGGKWGEDGKWGERGKWGEGGKWGGERKMRGGRGKWRGGRTRYQLGLGVEMGVVKASASKGRAPRYLPWSPPPRALTRHASCDQPAHIAPSIHPSPSRLS